MTRTRIPGIAIAALIMTMPAAASATNWWWVAGEPGGDHAWFVDTDSISADGSELSFRLQHLARGRAPDLQQRRADCAGIVGGKDDQAIQRFVCATPEERLSLGAMLGPIAPEVAANALFDAPASAMARR